MASVKNGITALILAGGRATRMGGVDKGLVELAGKTMTEHVIARLEPQVEHLLLNANRSLNQYAELGLAVVPDTLEDFQGPLAGMLAGLQKCTTPLLLSAPCDSPVPPLDYAERMLSALESEQADIAVATDGIRLQPVFCLIRTQLAESLNDYLATGDRKIDLWFAQHKMARVSFEDQPEAFANINRPKELAEIEKLLS